MPSTRLRSTTATAPVLCSTMVRTASITLAVGGTTTGGFLARRSSPMLPLLQEQLLPITTRAARPPFARGFRKRSGSAGPQILAVGCAGRLARAWGFRHACPMPELPEPELPAEHHTP